MGKHLGPDDAAEARAPRSRVRRIATIGAIAVLALLVGFLGYAAVSHRNPLQIALEPFVQTPQQLFGKDHLVVLVEGLDYDYNEKDEEYSSASRSDVIWAVNLDFANKRIYELSIPRDMEATMPNGRVAKINEAQSDGGVNEAQAVISKWLGIRGFDRYMQLRINAAKDLIDAIGGVDVNVMNSDPSDKKSEMSYDDSWGHLHIHLKPGFQHLNGPQAVGYMRFREDWCGDPCRIKRQQQVLKALTDKLKNDKVNTLLHANDLIGVLQRNVTTNFRQAELLSLATYFIGLDAADVHTAQVPYTRDEVIADGDAIVPDVAQRAKLVQNMLIAPPTPEPPVDPAALAAIAPSKVRIDIENASGVDGAAARIAASLKAKGFTIGDVGNADPTTQSAAGDITKIEEHTPILYAGLKVRTALGPVARAVPIETKAPSPAPRSDVTIVIGRDVADAVTAPKPTPAP